MLFRSTAVLPDKHHYRSQIERSQEYLFSGDSYELCLTAPTRVLVPNSFYRNDQGSTSWEQYKRLRKRNPAPHSAYLRLHPSTLISSSPERFLSYSRAPSTCQLRPIKGTVRKGPGVTREVAEQALVGSTKEVAENLMIVDLIRNDLSRVSVPGTVAVDRLFQVERVGSLWQMTSTVHGDLAPEIGRAHV